MQTDTTSTKKTTTKCPKCSSALQDFAVNFSYKVLMCENVKCPYPFDEPTGHTFLVKDNSIPKFKKHDDDKHVISPGAFSLEQTIESLLLNSREQENLDIFTTENPKTDARIQNNDGNMVLNKEKNVAETTVAASDYSLQDIEQLLQDQDTVTTNEFDSSSIQDLEQFFSDGVSPEGSENGQPEQSCVTTPMDDQSGLFNGLDQILGDDDWNKEYNPFSTELDSLLGL